MCTSFPKEKRGGTRVRPRSWNARLEREAEPKLDLPIAERLGAGDHAEIAPREIAVGIGKVRSIGQVVGLDTELAFKGLGEREVLKDREVHVGASGSAQDITA